MKRLVLIFLTALFTVGMVGCNKAETAPEANTDASADETAAGKDADEASNEPEEGTVAIGNPWKDDVSADDVYKLIDAYFIVPDGAQDVTYRINESDRLAEMNFTLDDLAFCARMKPTEALEDISGLYYEWDGELDDTVSGAEAKFRSAVSDSEMVHNVIWFDESGMSFSLMTSDKDLDGFDITAVVEAMYQPEGNSDDEFMPESFVEENAGKERFTGFDELISFLKPGQGYAYIELTGYDGKVLAVTEETFDDPDGHKASTDVAVYAEVNGEVKNIGNAFSSGNAYPVRCDGSLLYTGSDHEYGSYFVTGDGDGLMMKDSITEESDEGGNVSYFGFTRETNDFDDTKDIPEDSAECEKLFKELMDKAMKQPVIDFTVVE